MCSTIDSLPSIQNLSCVHLPKSSPFLLSLFTSHFFIVGHTQSQTFFFLSSFLCFSCCRKNPMNCFTASIAVCRHSQFSQSSRNCYTNGYNFYIIPENRLEKNKFWERTKERHSQIPSFALMNMAKSNRDINIKHEEEKLKRLEKQMSNKSPYIYTHTEYWIIVRRIHRREKYERDCQSNNGNENFVRRNWLNHFHFIPSFFCFSSSSPLYCVWCPVHQEECTNIYRFSKGFFFFLLHLLSPLHQFMCHYKRYLQLVLKQKKDVKKKNFVLYTNCNNCMI